MIRRFGRSHIIFGAELRQFFSALSMILQQQNELLMQHNAILMRLEQGLQMSRSQPATNVETETALLLENEQRQYNHVERMNARGENAEIRDQIIARMHTRYQVYLRDLFRNKPGFILDIGCGFADIWFNYLHERGFTYYGLDMHEAVVAHMSELLKIQGDGKYMRKGPIEDIPYPDQFFDVVYASHILEHTFDITKTLSEIKRVMKIQDFLDNGFVIETSGQFDFNLNEFYGRAVKRV
jgi:ubiquinone/menaquinone biosynthesis C-methylase UbiE